MSEDDDIRDCVKRVPNSLSFSQAQVNFILGHSLARLYQDLLETPVPDHLKVLLDQLEDRQWPEEEDRHPPHNSPRRAQ